jgi:hypothetical protein
VAPVSSPAGGARIVVPLAIPLPFTAADVTGIKLPLELCDTNNSYDTNICTQEHTLLHQQQQQQEKVLVASVPAEAAAAAGCAGCGSAATQQLQPDDKQSAFEQQRCWRKVWLTRIDYYYYYYY